MIPASSLTAKSSSLTTMDKHIRVAGVTLFNRDPQAVRGRAAPALSHVLPPNSIRSS